MREPQHIADFFVDAEYHRRGIGRRLFDAMRKDKDDPAAWAAIDKEAGMRTKSWTPKGGN